MMGIWPAARGVHTNDPVTLKRPPSSCQPVCVLPSMLNRGCACAPAASNLQWHFVCCRLLLLLLGHTTPAIQPEAGREGQGAAPEVCHNQCHWFMGHTALLIFDSGSVKNVQGTGRLLAGEPWSSKGTAPGPSTQVTPLAITQLAITQPHTTMGVVLLSRSPQASQNTSVRDCHLHTHTQVNTYAASGASHAHIMSDPSQSKPQPVLSQYFFFALHSPPLI